MIMSSFDYMIETTGNSQAASKDNEMKSFDYHSLSPSLLLYELCDPYVSGNNFIIIIRTTPRSDYLRDISFTSEATSLLFIDLIGITLTLFPISSIKQKTQSILYHSSFH